MPKAFMEAADRDDQGVLLRSDWGEGAGGEGALPGGVMAASEAVVSSGTGCLERTPAIGRLL